MARHSRLPRAGVVWILCALMSFPVWMPLAPTVRADYDINAPASFEVSGVVWHSRLDKLFAVDDGGRVVRMDRDGTNQTLWDVPGDLEGICVPDPSSDRLYVGIEYDGGQAKPAIEEFNLTTGMVTRTFYLNLPGATVSQGLEALSFVPNASHPQGGQFAVGHQGNGDIYFYDIPIVTGGGSGATYDGNGTLVTNKTDLAGLHYNITGKMFYALFDSYNVIQTIRVNGSPIHEFILPSKAWLSEDEGIGEDDNGTLYIARENGTEGIISAIRGLLDTSGPRVKSVALSDPSPTRAGLVNYTIGFDEPLDMLVNPVVSFGKMTPFGEHMLTPGGWLNSTHWWGTFAIDTGTGDGLQNLSIGGARDAVGNIMDTDSGHTFVIDTLAPRVQALSLSAPSPLGKGQYNITITFNEPVDNSTAPVVTFGTAPPYKANAVAPMGWKSAFVWECRVTINNSSGEGLNHIRVGGATDFANNTMLDDWNNTFSVDTTSPRVISVVLSDPSPTMAGTVMFTITFDEDMDQGITPVAAFGLLPPFGAHVLTPLGWTDERSWTGNCPIDNATGDGLNRLVIVGAADVLGNQMSPDNATTFVIDATAPVVLSVKMSPSSPVSVGTVNFSITFSEPIDAGVAPAAAFGLSSPYVNHTLTETAWANETCLNGSFHIDSNTGDGNQTFTVRGARDIAGNGMLVVSGWAFTVDTTPPVSVVVPGSLPAFQNRTVFQVPISASDPSPGTGIARIELWYRLNGTGAPVLFGTAAAGQGMEFIAAGDGTYELHSVAVDLAGNREAEPSSQDAITVVDTRRPMVAQVELARSGPYDSDVGITIRFDEPVNSSRLRVTTGTVSPFEGLTLSGNGTGPDEWTGTIPISSSVMAGNYTISISGAFDRAWNLLVPDTSTTFRIERANATVDILPPVVISVTVDRTPPVGAGPVNATIIFSEDMDRAQGLSVGLVFGSGAPRVLAGRWTGNRTWEGTVSVDTAWQNGTHLFAIRGGRDLAGNPMPEDRAHSMIVKLEAPPVTKPPGSGVRYDPWAIGAVIGICALAIVIAIVLKRRKDQGDGEGQAHGDGNGDGAGRRDGTGQDDQEARHAQDGPQKNEPENNNEENPNEDAPEKGAS